DAGVAFGGSAGVAGNVLAAQGTLEAPDMAVGVAGQVGEDVADGPAGQAAGPSRRSIVHCGHCAEQSLMRRAADLDRRGGVGLGHRGAPRWTRWVTLRSATKDRNGTMAASRTRIVPRTD